MPTIPHCIITSKCGFAGQRRWVHQRTICATSKRKRSTFLCFDHTYVYIRRYAGRRTSHNTKVGNKVFWSHSPLVERHCSMAATVIKDYFPGTLSTHMSWESFIVPYHMIALYGTNTLLLTLQFQKYNHQDLMNLKTKVGINILMQGPTHMKLDKPSSRSRNFEFSTMHAKDAICKTRWSKQNTIFRTTKSTLRRKFSLLLTAWH